MPHIIISQSVMYAFYDLDIRLIHVQTPDTLTVGVHNAYSAYSQCHTTNKEASYRSVSHVLTDPTPDGEDTHLYPAR